MKKWLLLIIMIFTATGAFASSGSVLNPDAVNHYTDISIFYLSQLFGTVGSILTGDHSQMMGKLFYVLNWGVFSISGVLVGYTTFLSTMKMATEGITIQPGRSTVYAMIKLAIGVSLVIPNAATGYSVVQEVVMKTVVQGVGLADSIWNSAMDYLADGGTVFTAPQNMTPNNKTSNSHYDAIENSKNTDGLYGNTTGDANTTDLAFAATIFQNEVCMIGSRDTSSISGTVTPYYTAQLDPAHQQIRFPGLSDTDQSGASCGTVSWALKNASDEQKSIMQSAVTSLANDLMPIAKQYYCERYGNTNYPNGAVCSGIPQPHQQYGYAPTLFNAALNYFSAVQIIADAKNNQNNQKQNSLFNAAKRQGWLTAGRYYWDVMQQTGKSAGNQNLTAYIPQNPPAANGTGAADQAFASLINTSGSTLTENYNQYFAAYKSSVMNGSTSNSSDATQQTSENSEDLVGDWSSAGLSFAAGPLAGVMAMAFTHINKIGVLFSHPDSNPIIFLNKIGQELLSITWQVWVMGAFAMAGVGLTAIMSGESPVWAIFQNWAMWMRPLLMTAATLCLLAGFFLCYFIPIYPYMIFLFATVGWFVSVIEAMVAAPIVALGMAHPENHDFLGKAEQGLMLLLGIFMQPALLVIGMMGGIILSFVSFEILIYTFSAFITDVLTNSAKTQFSSNIINSIQSSGIVASGVMEILVVPLILIIFCSIIYTLITQSFSLIFVLRDNVMRWIGVPQSGLARPDQLADQTIGGASNAIQQGSDGANKAATQGLDPHTGQNIGNSSPAEKMQDLSARAFNAAANSGPGRAIGRGFSAARQGLANAYQRLRGGGGN